MAIDDAVSRSKSVAPGSPIDTWFGEQGVEAGGLFEIVVESLSQESSAIEIRGVFSDPSVPDVVLATLRATDRFPSGPHIMGGGSDKIQIQLTALAADAGQTTCDVSYTAKWLK